MNLRLGPAAKLTAKLLGVAFGLAVALFLFSSVAFGHGYSGYGGGYGGCGSCGGYGCGGCFYAYPYSTHFLSTSNFDLNLNIRSNVTSAQNFGYSIPSYGGCGFCGGCGGCGGFGGYNSSSYFNSSFSLNLNVHASTTTEFSTSGFTGY